MLVKLSEYLNKGIEDIYCEGCEALEQVAPSRRLILGQVRQGFEQTALVKGVPVHGTGVELDYL